MAAMAAGRLAGRAAGAGGGLPCPLTRLAFPAGQRRRMSGAGAVSVELDERAGVALVRLQQPPVNGLSLPLLTELCLALQKLEDRRACRGLVLTSGSSPAGGCLMALSCDYRIMADNPKYNIGLNETRLGIVAPFWFKDTLLNTVGHRASERSLQLGLLYSPQEALKIGLVDELMPEEKIQARAAEIMAQWLAIPDHARQLSKSALRKQALDHLLMHREADIQDFVRFISRDAIQKSLQKYMEMLKRKKA